MVVAAIDVVFANVTGATDVVSFTVVGAIDLVFASVIGVVVVYNGHNGRPEKCVIAVASSTKPPHPPFEGGTGAHSIVFTSKVDLNVNGSENNGSKRYCKSKVIALLLKECRVARTKDEE